MKLPHKLQAERKAEERLNAKTQPLTRTASTASEQNGFGFSSALSQAQHPPTSTKLPEMNYLGASE
jgi:hypothetical protein